MSNMSYVRFENTLTDLIDCQEHMWDDLDEREHNRRKHLIKVCREIAEEVTEEDWPARQFEEEYKEG